MNYRLLRADEWSRLESIMPSNFIPQPEVCTAAIAEDEQGQLCGVLFLQLAFHLEPLVLRAPDVRFDKLYKTLYNAVEQSKGLHFYCFADSEVVAKMAEHVGMLKRPYEVFEGEVK